MTSIDNAEQYEAWNNDSGRRWARESDRRDRILSPIADVLLAAARLRPGERVLDIGCGCGATTLTAAAAVRPGGEVTGIDLSGPMLDVARHRQESVGVTNVMFVHGDAQMHVFLSRGSAEAPARVSPEAKLPEPFDVAISRFGTMFFADPVAAFTNIAAGLRPGGRLALATWQPLPANDWLIVPATALLRYGTMPPIDLNAPGPFAQAEPDAVTRVLTEAGYADVRLTPVHLDLTVGADLEDAVDYVTNSRVCRMILADTPEREVPAALDAVRVALADHVDDDGVHLGAAIWIVTATRS
jgi:SAM-dependent methyltransferase